MDGVVEAEAVASDLKGDEYMGGVRWSRDVLRWRRIAFVLLRNCEMSVMNREERTHQR